MYLTVKYLKRAVCARNDNPSSVLFPCVFLLFLCCIATTQHSRGPRKGNQKLKRSMLQCFRHDGSDLQVRRHTVMQSSTGVRSDPLCEARPLQIPQRRSASCTRTPSYPLQRSSQGRAVRADVHWTQASRGGGSDDRRNADGAHRLHLLVLAVLRVG
jgi:hypothetical protein